MDCRKRENNCQTLFLNRPKFTSLDDCGMPPSKILPSSFSRRAVRRRGSYLEMVNNLLDSTIVKQEVQIDLNFIGIVH